MAPTKKRTGSPTKSTKKKQARASKTARSKKPAASTITFATARELACALPGVEESTSYGTPALKVKGKLFARLKEDGETLVVKVDREARDALVAARPNIFFVTDHYRPYPYMLV